MRIDRVLAIVEAAVLKAILVEVPHQRGIEIAMKSTVLLRTKIQSCVLLKKLMAKLDSLLPLTVRAERPEGAKAESGAAVEVVGRLGKGNEAAGKKAGNTQGIGAQEIEKKVHETEARGTREVLEKRVQESQRLETFDDAQ
jgi:hypothetical protein